MRRAITMLVALALVAAGCSSGRRTTSLAVETTEPAPGRVSISAPATVKSGVVEVRFKNSGAQPHDAQLVRVDGDRAIEAVVDIMTTEGMPVPSWLHPEGGVATIAAGASHSATMILPPGQYYVIDTGSDDAGNPFAKAGGVRRLTVTEGGLGGELPKAAAAITAKEYEFGVPGDLAAGTRKVRFDNRGTELHVLVAAPILPGKTLEDVRQALGAPPSSAPPPLDFARATGTGILEGGKSLVTEMRLQKGAYAFICFLSDRSGGPPHFVLGMLQEVRVG